MDESIKQVTENYERSLIAVLGTAFEKFNSKIGFTRNLSTEKRAEYTHRARKVLDGNQLADLSKVLSALKQYNSSASSRSFFVVIDRIDERWVDESIRFQLIRALFDAVKPFGKIRDLKIIVSMRVDVLERVIFETRDLGFQRDKFEDQSYRIKWTKERLKSLVDKRIDYLCQWQYTTENVHFDHIFKHNVSSKAPFDYMLERSFLRPRDLINFVNLCLNEADGRHEVTASHVKAAERRYSSTMIDGIISEWASILPSLKFLLPKVSGSLSLVELSSLVDHDFLVDFYVKVEAANLPFEDSLTKVARQFFEDDSSNNYSTAATTIAAELYRTGIIGLKLQANDRYRFSYKDEPRINAESIDLRTRCQIHNALHIALNITPANRQPRVRSLAN
jgi:hypothetical protein